MRVAIFLLAAIACRADDPKPKASDYPAHAELPKLAIGAEFLVRSILTGGQAFTADDFLVVDVALYPAPDTTVALALKDFVLRVNGHSLKPAAPQFVASAFRHPEDARRPRLEAEAGYGGADVILGRPRASERFPGDPTPRQGRLPEPPRAPKREPAELRGDEVAVNEAMPEGEIESTRRGFLYFPYKGRTKSIKTVEFLYDGPAGKATLKLR